MERNASHSELCELFLARSAFGAGPIIREVLERGAWGDVLGRVSYGRVIHISAHIALVLVHALHSLQRYPVVGTLPCRASLSFPSDAQDAQESVLSHPNWLTPRVSSEEKRLQNPSGRHDEFRNSAHDCPSSIEPMRWKIACFLFVEECLSTFSIVQGAGNSGIPASIPAGCA